MVEFVQKPRYTAQDLVRIVALLRQPEGGCPWDKAQTHASIRQNFIEETYEAVEAIDLGDPELLQEELGDVLLQVALHCQMEAERGAFDFDEVCNGICQKLLYRHPHVFGDVAAATPDEALRNWEQLKNTEKGRATAASRLDSVPASLPALMRAAKTQKRAVPYGFGCTDPAAALADLEAELAELKAALAAGQDPEAELGDVLFAAAGLARTLGAEPELALSGATGRFKERVKACERMAAEGGSGLEELTGPERAACWKRAKLEEQSSKG
ncbi:hypothetical protein CE91St44_11660 [Oscillospiraceae bacterium]|nr:hypothetical protein CE91St44_11660 [Oscillospiraceae bacterium]